MSEKPWWVYMIECRGGRIYTGISPDPARRYADHKAGRGAAFTRINSPERLLATVRFPNRPLAARAERVVKKMPGYDTRMWALAIAGPGSDPETDSHVRAFIGDDLDDPHAVAARFLKRLRELGYSSSSRKRR